MNPEWKMVVLDDDPTGIQTVHGCLLVTQWDEQSIREAFADDVPFFYLLTNTRALTRNEAARTTRDAMQMVVRVSREYDCRLFVVSRSDSCLRGHFPLETDIMRQCLEKSGYQVAPKTPFCPAFIEAGRVTIGGVHYMRDGEQLIPVSETEFARDNVFAYHTSVLSDYIREKGASPDNYIIMNAQSYDELHRSLSPLLDEQQPYDAWVIRSSSSLPKALADVSDQPLLSREALFSSSSSSDFSGVGLFVVGSHVQKTTRQLEQLFAADGVTGVEVDVQRLLAEPDALMQQTLHTLSRLSAEGQTPVVYTSRQEIRLADASQRQHLGQQVSSFLVQIVRNLPFVPAYLVGKGGITSHDLLTQGLGIRSARVLGQVINNVPCIRQEGSLPYIIFPGNVGTDTSLRDLFEKLRD